jgi:hypothetical protein
VLGYAAEIQASKPKKRRVNFGGYNLATTIDFTL